MSGEEVPVTVANITFPVPVYVSEERTQELARQLQELYERVEQSSRRIDTPILALQTAFAIAVELDKLRESKAHDEAEIRKALTNVADRLSRLANP